MNESQGAVGDSERNGLETIQCELAEELSIAAAIVFLKKRMAATGEVPLAVQISNSTQGWRQAALSWIEANRRREGKKQNVA